MNACITRLGLAFKQIDTQDGTEQVKTSWPFQPALTTSSTMPHHPGLINPCSQPPGMCCFSQVLEDAPLVAQALMPMEREM